MVDEKSTQNWFWRLSHPGAFLNWSGKLIPPLAILTAITFAVGLYYAFFGSPPDYQQGEMVRVFYIHVPNATLCMGIYATMALSAIGTLVWRHPMADVSARAAAPIGACYTAAALITGSIWGRPTWGTWWEWDGRLTSVLILLFIYLGIIALWQTFADQAKGARLIAILTLVGAINLPIIHYSVEWWNTLHQSAGTLSFQGSTVANEFLLPFFIMFAGFALLFITLQLTSMRSQIYRARSRAIERRNVQNMSPTGGH